MAYKHGTYGEITDSKAVAAAQADTVVVYVGTAPINKIAGYASKGLINQPVRLRNLTEAKSTFGYSDDWAKFTLCEAFDEHFNNTVANAGPIYVINVLDPSTDKGAQVTISDADFTSGKVYIANELCDVDSVRVTGKVLDTDYRVYYDAENDRAVVEDLTGAMTEEDITYYPVNAAAVTTTDIIGTSSGGVSTGIQAIKKVYTKYGVVPNLLVAPGWSEFPTVYAAMVSAIQKINGHWDAFALADIPINDNGTPVDTKEKAIAWQASKDYNAERSKVCWPQKKAGNGKIYHISTVCAATMLRVDQANDSVPMESPSNKQIMATGQYFGASATNEGYDDTECNDLNEKGITTICFSHGAWRLWGPHTAAYKYGSTMDPRVIFDNNMRMLMYITNGFQLRHGTEIDAPMTPAQKDTVVNAEKAELERLKALGAIIGDADVEFLESANPLNDMLNGDFVFDISFTATPPFKSATARVAYTSDGFAAFFGGE